MSATATLRARTAALHDEVDAAFSGFRLDDVASYRAFLLAHARALPGVEAELAAWPELPLGTGRTPLLAQDLAALGEAMPPTLPFTAKTDAAAWGALYVIEGSRLGGAMLAQQVGTDLPHAYLGARFGPGEWKGLREAIDRAASQHGPAWLEAMTTGASACFALYRKAAGYRASTGALTIARTPGRPSA